MTQGAALDSELRALQKTDSASVASATEAGKSVEPSVFGDGTEDSSDEYIDLERLEKNEKSFEIPKLR